MWWTLIHENQFLSSINQSVFGIGLDESGLQFVYNNMPGDINFSENHIVLT